MAPLKAVRVKVSKEVACTWGVPTAFSVNPLGENLTKLPEVADVYSPDNADNSLVSTELRGVKADPPKDSILIVDLLLATTHALFACKSIMV